MVRLQKYMAECGAASRRKAEELITAGKVKVNGTVVTEMGMKISPGEDIVELEGRVLIHRTTHTYIMLHKPEGYVTTVKDQFERPSVLDLVKDEGGRLYPVGRLDYDTSGLLLLTDDGDLTYKLTHPRHSIDKVYVARIQGVPDQASLDAFRKGLEIEDYITAPAKIQIVKQETGACSVKITIREGRNRQVRKMLAAIGHTVIRLKRVATGRLYLGDLRKGKYRCLTEDEIKYLKEI